MIVLIVGNLGSGKSLLLTAFGIAALEEKKRVYASYHINYKTKDGRSAEYVDVGDLILQLSSQEKQVEMHSGLLLFDEAYTGTDSRMSQSVANRLTSRFVFQSRKLGLDLIVACQLASSIDLRIRRLVDMYILAEALPRDKPDEHDFQYSYVSNSGDNNDFVLSWENANKIFPYYSTMEIVMPPMIALDKEEAKAAKHLLDSIAIDRRLKEKGRAKKLEKKKRQQQRKRR